MHAITVEVIVNFYDMRELPKELKRNYILLFAHPVHLKRVARGSKHLK